MKKAFTVNAEDVIASRFIRALTLEQVGALFLLWCYACTEGSLPSDLHKLKRLVGGSIDDNALAEVVGTLTVNNNGELEVLWIKEQAERLNRRSAIAAANAKRRWSATMKTDEKQGTANPTQPTPAPQKPKKLRNKPSAEELAEIDRWYEETRLNWPKRQPGDPSKPVPVCASVKLEKEAFRKALRDYKLDPQVLHVALGYYVSYAQSNGGYIRGLKNACVDGEFEPYIEEAKAYVASTTSIKVESIVNGDQIQVPLEYDIPT